MAKLVLTISANNQATQSVKLLNAEVQTLSETLSSIKVNKNLTTQINALSKYYTNLAKAAVKVNAATTQRQIAEQKLANEVKRGRTEEQRTLKVKAQREQAELRLKQAEDKAAQSTQKQTTAVKQGTKENEEHRQSILSMTRGILEWQIATTLVMKPLRMLQNALQSINDTLVKTEDTVIAFQRVVGKNISGETISSELYRLAQDYGQTFDNVQSIALDFARTGLSWNDTIKATEAALLGLNTAELDATSAATGLIAVMQQFGLEASQLESIIDKLNITQDNAAVTTDKLLAALQRTGSSAANANLSLEETVALITALSSATGRSGENIGTALNSLIQYSRKESALNVFAGLSDESAAVVDNFKKGAATILDVWKQVSKEIQSLDSRQADLLDSYFSTEDGAALSDALDGELEDIYTEMNGVYDTANTFRKNYFIALLGNMDEVEAALGRMDKSANYSQKQNEDYLKSYTAKVNSLNAKWQELANSAQGLLGLKKALVDIGSVLLSIVKRTGGLRTTLLSVGTMAVALFGARIYNAIAKAGTALKSFFTNLVAGFKAGASAAEQFQAALGWIGLIGTALSLIIGGIVKAVKEQRAAEEEANKEAVEHWQSIREEAQQLEELSRKYASLTSDSEEYAEVEQNIIDLLGTKAIRLAGLTKGTEEYRKELEKLTEEQRKQNKEAATRAANAAQELFDSQKYNKLQDYELGAWSTNAQGTYLGGVVNEENTALFDALEKAGYNIKRGVKNTGGARGYKFGTDYAKLLLSGDAFQDERTLSELITFLLDNGYGSTDFYNEIYDAWESRNNAITDYLEGFVPSYAYEDIASNEEFDSIIDSIMQATNATENWRSTIEGIVSSISGYIKTQEDVTDNWSNSIKDAIKQYDDLISKLEELRDLNKEAYDWEEKKLAVLEAEQALENARNEATVRRFNQSTGQWEWQTDEKTIKQAEDNLEKARLNLEEAAYDNIIKQLEEQTATNDSILAILKEVAPLLGEDFANAVQNAIQDTTGVDLSQPIVSEDGSYDSGGIANGLGYMPKATSEPETVNNPELTAKILSPVSNAQFDKYVRDMGIMFETARQYSQAPVIERVGGATDNRVDNSGQITMNGVTIGSDRRGNSLDELLTLANIIPKA